MTTLKSLEDLPSIGFVLAAPKEQDAQASEAEAGPSVPAPQNGQDMDSGSDSPLYMRGLRDYASSPTLKKAVLAQSDTDESNNTMAGSVSTRQLINVPTPAQIIPPNDNAMPGWTSSVSSMDGDEEANKARRIYRVSSDDASSVYSNDESGVVSMAGLTDDRDVTRPISPIMGLFEQTMAATRRGNDSAPVGTSNMATQTRGASSTGAMQENHPMTDASRNTSFGSIIRQACSEGRDALSYNAYPPAARGRHNFVAPTALQQIAQNRHVSGKSGVSNGTVANYSRRGLLRVATESPYPPPTGPLPPTPDWKPVTARRQPYIPPPPERTPPSVPAPPEIPLRKRPSLTNEELDILGKKAGHALQTRFMMEQSESFASAGNLRPEKPLHGSRTSADFKVPDLVPEGLHVRKGRTDETRLRSGRQAPQPQLASAITAQFDTARTQADFRGHGNSRPPLAFQGESRIRPSASQGQQIRPSASQAMPLNKANLDHMQLAYQRSQQLRPTFSWGQSSLHTSINVYETTEDFSVSRHGDVPTKSNVHNGRTAANPPPTPATFADTESPTQRDTKGTAPTLYTPAIVRPGAPAGGLSFRSTEAHEKYTMEQMLKDREEVVAASARLRDMGSGYFGQRATQRPKTLKVETTDFAPAAKVVEHVGEIRLPQAESPTLVPRPASPTKGFKGKMQRVAEKLKLRKSSKNLREIKRTDTKVSKMSLGSSHGSKSQKGRSTPSIPLARQRSGAELMVSEDDEIPPVPAIPLRHRKTFKKMEESKGKAKE